MNRRGFLGLSLAAVGGIFVPKYDKWYRQGSGLLLAENVGDYIAIIDGGIFRIGDSIPVIISDSLSNWNALGRIVAIDRKVITVEWNTGQP